ncbi:hypothetical protein Taro_032230 [Colocasia esculenta]|uniref:Uncharacterized protein n=1 Tax=Colocasia esculenta TaxID=4460 RepID=A0A843W5H2_COLES|nr:hypothetical protein [Colocasia esculenta]
MALLHHTLLFHAPSRFHIPKLRTTGSVGSGLPIPRTRAGRSLTEPATSFHKQGQRRREPAGNTAPCPCFVLSEGVRGLTLAIAAAALLLCLGPGVTEAGADGGRRVPPSLPCVDVAGYYSGVDGLEGVALMRRLGDIVSVHRSLAYKEVWDALKILDAADPNDPENSAEVMEIYSLRSVRKSPAGKREGWNREHLWPRSYGLIDKASLTDLHNLRPVDVNVNSSRGNKYFGDCFSESNGCSRPANIEAAPDTETDNQRWAPPVQVRGDIARSLMYMAVCYGFQQPGGPHLQLSDSPNAKNREMGLLSALLEWNKLDPPSEAEKLRNERICRVYQHNRNPFIDHPEYANLLWKQTTTRSKMYKVSSKAWINEFHSDNKGKDRNVIIADPSVEASKLRLVLYNGSTRKVYQSLRSLFRTFTVSDSISELLIYTGSLPLQNGPDGIALVSLGDDDQPEVIQFLSCEGTLKAVDGPARGEVSVDVSIQETEASSEHDSLGLTGITRA